MKGLYFPKKILRNLILFPLLIVACTSTPVKLIPTKNAVPEVQSPAGTQIPTGVPEVFPLAGTWSGDVQNGDLTFQVALTLNSACRVGGTCGSFSLPVVPCTGTYILSGEEDQVYLFDITDRSPACGTGRDSMRLLAEDTLEWISRGDYGETRGILQRTEPVAQPEQPLPVIFNDDGSPDGTTAFFYLLSDPAASVQAVIISHGEAHPQVYVQHMARVMDSLGLTGIPLGYGLDTAIIPGPDFPEWIRSASDEFWGHPIPLSEKTYPVQNAADLIVELLNQAQGKWAVFVSGACTDLALALRKDAGIAAHISRVYIMGGAIYVKGNMADFFPDDPNKVAEWNIFVDPLAASEVFQAGVPVTLVPLDATNQVFTNMSETSQWRRGGVPARLAADFYDGLLGGSPENQTCLWDVMTAVVMLHPELCELTPLALEVVTDPGNSFGQTRVVEGGTPNVDVCLQPDIAGIKQVLIDQFSTVP